MYGQNIDQNYVYIGGESIIAWWELKKKILKEGVEKSAQIIKNKLQ